MEIVVWIGAAMSVIGLIGIGYSVVMVTRAKRANLSDADMRARLAKVLPVNLGALFVSVLGLMTVAVGIMLG
ncbi:hypothetical protein [Yoonia sp.]|jgi:hypothetical protein|uniref:hypothetical protein n=1 Tax=Yoonia sp. TaxID=2212373 RepID=UPI001BCD6660|nr:hypothetical protein [Yoonia sp.]MBR2575011.1 hypothetical protein [Loktanella sp.]MDA0722382.1 hypothetical protein [Pseudomonadota bacterium]MDA1155724.1 hypothetical protein [Pseudomonadota bacterium]